MYINTANANSFISSIPIHKSFGFFSCVFHTLMNMSSSTVMTRNGYSGHPCHVPKFLKGVL